MKPTAPSSPFRLPSISRKCNSTPQHFRRGNLHTYTMICGGAYPVSPGLANGNATGKKKGGSIGAFAMASRLRSPKPLEGPLQGPEARHISKSKLHSLYSVAVKARGYPGCRVPLINIEMRLITGLLTWAGGLRLSSVL